MAVNIPLVVQMLEARLAGHTHGDIRGLSDSNRHVRLRLQGSIRLNHWLEYYAQRFNTTELNITHYHLLSEPGVYGILNKFDLGIDFLRAISISPMARGRTPRRPTEVYRAWSPYSGESRSLAVCCSSFRPIWSRAPRPRRVPSEVPSEEYGPARRGPVRHSHASS